MGICLGGSRCTEEYTECQGTPFLSVSRSNLNGAKKFFEAKCLSFETHKSATNLKWLSSGQSETTSKTENTDHCIYHVPKHAVSLLSMLPISGDFARH